jgi:hypothetical protein
MAIGENRLVILVAVVASGACLSATIRYGIPPIHAALAI